MSFRNVQKIPSPEEMKAIVPLAGKLQDIKAARDAEIKKILENKSDKFLVIVGPCSADEESAVCDYVYRLASVQEKVADKLLLVPRIYTNKPRTTGEGYKGMLHQPDPESAPNMVDGILSIRRMHVRAITESGLTAADEMLYPDNYIFVEDMLSYIAIGARSVENQQHRLTASGMHLPVGMKNPTSGDLTVMFNSISAAQGSHSFIYQNCEVETSGNPLAHAIMRGSVNKHGECIPNYHYEDLMSASELYAQRGLANPMIVVDTNHANSKKQHLQQIRIAKEVLHSRRHSADVQSTVRGLMIESYIEAGAQKVGEHVYGKSITDACLGWADTEKLLYTIAESI